MTGMPIELPPTSIYAAFRIWTPVILAEVRNDIENHAKNAA
jgi:hypothetical protein